MATLFINILIIFKQRKLFEIFILNLKNKLLFITDNNKNILHLLRLKVNRRHRRRRKEQTNHFPQGNWRCTC